MAVSIGAFALIQTDLTCEHSQVSDIQSRAVLVEDHTLTRTLMTSMLTSLGFLTWAAEAVDEGMDLIQKMEPDLLVTDLDLGVGPSGVELAAWTQKSYPQMGIVLLTAHRSTRLVDPQELAENPRRVHLLKEEITSPEVLRSAIRIALQEDPSERHEVSEPARYSLSRDQADVLRLMAQGMSNAAIAAKRGSSVSAVENIARRIYAALDLAGNDAINPRSAAILMFQRSEIAVD